MERQGREITTGRIGNCSIGKFDVLATYTFVKALLEGYKQDEARQRGIVAAIMGSQARLGISKEHRDDSRDLRDAGEKKKLTAITANSFEHQVAAKMGEFLDSVF
jgi:hypothetical protein